VYDRHDYADERRIALERWSQELKTLTETPNASEQREKDKTTKSTTRLRLVGSG
jgi:hypothetical protein